MSHLGKHNMQNIFEKSLHLGVAHAVYLSRKGPSCSNSHISHTAYTGNFIRTPKNAKSMVPYSELLHFIATASLYFKLNITKTAFLP